ncbi:MAG: LamG-like jellyroll fold domain-containing protein [Phycisphaeraceae bacterium]
MFLKSLSLTAALALCVTASHANAALVNHYTFDSDASDSGTMGRNGTLVDNASINTTEISRASGSTGSLDLTAGGYVQLPSGSTDTFGEWTLAMWAKIAQEPEPDGIAALFTNDAWPPSSNEYIHVNYVPGELSASVGFPLTYEGVSAPPTDWIHVAITHQSVGEGTKLYINGTEVDSIELGGPTLIFDSARVGNWTGQERPFNGWIDDLRIYDEVLTGSEVMALVPEPTSMALLGLGAVSMLKRRRRS